jgi:hypothetical protein
VRKPLLLVLFTLCTLQAGFAQITPSHIQGKLENLESSRKLEVGDTIWARLTIWPTPQDIVFKKNDLEDKDIFGFFYVSSVLKIERSVNNSEAVVIEIYLTIAKPFLYAELHTLEINKLLIPVTFQGIERVGDRQLKANAFNILDSNYTKAAGLWARYKNGIMGGLAGLFLLVIGYLIFSKTYLKNKNKKKEEERQRVWTKKIADANTRKEFEDLVKNRKEWDAISLKQGESRLLIRKVELIQYKPEWTDEELKEVASLRAELLENVDGV